jgi:Flp pilus assembly protein TadG
VPAHARPRGAGRHCRPVASDAGTSSVELVITMPALLLVVFAVMQFGLWMHAQHVAQAAARDGAAVARSYDGTERAAHDRTAASLDTLGPTILRDPRIDVVRTGAEATVTVTGKATSILGIFSLGVREQASGQVERFVPRSDE